MLAWLGVAVALDADNADDAEGGSVQKDVEMGQVDEEEVEDDAVALHPAVTSPSSASQRPCASSPSSTGPSTPNGRLCRTNSTPSSSSTSSSSSSSIGLSTLLLGDSKGAVLSPSTASSTLRVGLLTALLLALHNLPEGLAVFVSTVSSSRAGLLMMANICLHNIPEGLVIATPVYASTHSAAQTLYWTALSGSTEPVGALLALTLLRPWLTPHLIQHMLSAVAGMMVAVAAVELWPSGRAYEQHKAMNAGMVTGFLCMAVTSLVAEVLAAL